MGVPYAFALHGGAGAIPLDTPDERKQRIYASLRRIVAAGREALEAGRSAVQVVELVVRELEDDELYNAGKGAVMNELGEHELDASIMDGATMNCGAVGGVTSPKNPVTLARKVMDDSRHVFMQGAGADRFARWAGVEQVGPTYFTTERRKRQLQMAKEAEAGNTVFEDPEKGTVGCVVLDSQGRLAAATSTGGRTNKRVGRVGDSPIIGAGNYANQRCAISCTGTGEEFIRFTVARDVAARVEFLGETAGEAAEHMIRDVLQPGDGGIIAVDVEGRISMPFSTQGMFRGYVDGTGQAGVGIWEELQPGD